METWAEIQKYRSDVSTAEANRAARETAAAEAAEAARLAALGPHFQLESSRVMATMRWGEKVAHASTIMKNTGTTALWYKWRQVPPPKASDAAPRAKRGTFYVLHGGDVRVVAPGGIARRHVDV